MTDLIKTQSHLQMNRSFGTQELNDLLEDAAKREPEFKTKTSFAPSGLGYQGVCPRYWYYAFNGAEFVYNNDATSVANMDNGSAAGVRLAGLLEKAGILIESEVALRHEDPPIFGYIDAIVNWKDKEVVVEVKTTNNNVWNWRVNKNEVPPYQMIQLLIYMYVTNHEYGFFMTENKDTHQLFILPVVMTDEYRQLVEDTFTWMRKVKDNAENGELPTRPFTYASKECKGCPVRAKCWEGYKRGSVNGTDPNPGSITLEVLNLPK